MFCYIYILIYFIYLFCFTILYWFCHTLTWIHHGCTCVPHPEPPSHIPPHPIPLGHPSLPAPSTLFHASNLDWRFISHIIISMFQCCSPISSHPCPLPQSPKDCSNDQIIRKKLLIITKEPLDENERGEWKSWLEAQHPENWDHGIWWHFIADRWGNSGHSGWL